MFNFFASLAIAIYIGKWPIERNNLYTSTFITYMKQLPIFGLFNNSTEAFYNSSGYVTMQFIDNSATSIPPLAITISVILSTICCISVFFIIVKALKKLFTCFLGD